MAGAPMVATVSVLLEELIAERLEATTFLASRVLRQGVRSASFIAVAFDQQARRNLHLLQSVSGQAALTSCGLFLYDWMPAGRGHWRVEQLSQCPECSFDAGDYPETAEEEPLAPLNAAAAPHWWEDLELAIAETNDLSLARETWDSYSARRMAEAIDELGDLFYHHLGSEISDLVDERRRSGDYHPLCSSEMIERWLRETIATLVEDGDQERWTSETYPNCCRRLAAKVEETQSEEGLGLNRPHER